MLRYRHVILILLLRRITTHQLLLLQHATLLTPHFGWASSLALLWKAARVPASRFFTAHLISTILRGASWAVHHLHPIVLLPACNTEAVRHIGRERIASWKSLLLRVESLGFASWSWLLAYWLWENGSRHHLLRLLLIELLLLLLNSWWLILWNWTCTTSTLDVRKLNLSRVRILKVLISFKGSIHLLRMNIWIWSSIEIRIALSIEALHFERFVVASWTSSRESLILILVL
jgi:hypothetical protein